MRFGNQNMSVPLYEDHVGLWAKELAEWMPNTLFDSHIHLGPSEATLPFAAERLKEPLCTFGSMTFEDAQTFYAHLFKGKQVDGLIAFPFPMREVQLDAANAYIIDLMKRDPRIHGFLLSEPTDAEPAIRDYERAIREGVAFLGVKPYFDRLGKSNYGCTMPEFIPDALLEFMNAEKLIMMLHTSGRGMGVPKNRDFVRSVLDRYADLRIILAHMGRYLDVSGFFDFFESDLADHPRLYLEMSSVSRADVYARVLDCPRACDRLLFGTDLPYGLLTGVEAWSEATGPVFITRDRYAWSNDYVNGLFAGEAKNLTYNTYHVIAAFKDAVIRKFGDTPNATLLKQKIFHDNALALLRG